MNQGTFKKVGQSDKPLYGPRAMLVCGFTSGEQQTLMEWVERIPLMEISVIFSETTDGQAPVGELLARPDQSGRNADSGPDRAIILAGITEKELKRTLPAYRECGLPRPLWATLTPYSEGWTLDALIAELKAERREMEKK